MNEMNAMGMQSCDNQQQQQQQQEQQIGLQFAPQSGAGTTVPPQQVGNAGFEYSMNMNQNLNHNPSVHNINHINLNNIYNNNCNKNNVNDMNDMKDMNTNGTYNLNNLNNLSNLNNFNDLNAADVDYENVTNDYYDGDQHYYYGYKYDSNGYYYETQARPQQQLYHGFAQAPYQAPSSHPSHHPHQVFQMKQQQQQHQPSDSWQYVQDADERLISPSPSSDYEIPLTMQSGSLGILMKNKIFLLCVV